MILNSPTISGSLTVTGNIIASGSITLSGSVASASYAATASFIALAQSASYVLTAQTASFVTNAQTASFVALAQSASNAVSAQTASFANAFTVASTLTAQTLVVQTITSSVDFVTGSTRFGSILDNTHIFSGSVTMNPGGLFVSSSGNVGIGVTPSAWSLGKAIEFGNIGNTVWGVNATQFNVLQNAYYNAGYYYASSNPASYYQQVSGVHTWYVAPSGTANAALTFTSSMTIINSGNVGIGTSSPSSRLYVRTTAGATKAYDDLSKTNIMCFDDTSMVEGVGGSITFGGYKTSTSAGGNFAAIDGIKENGTAGNEAGAFRIWTANSSGVFGERMRITSGGNVGIGTSSPSSLLHLSSSSNTAQTITSVGAGSYASIGFVNTTTGYGYDIGFGGSSTIAPNSFYIYGGSSASVKLAITSGGNVGIGTSSPAAKLEIAKAGTSFGVPSSAGVSISAGGGVGEYNQILFGYSAGDVSPAMMGYVTTDGAGSTKGALVFGTRDVTTASAPTERMRITSGGAVYINTTSALPGSGTIFHVYSNEACTTFANNSSGQQVLLLWNKATSGNNLFQEFATEATINGRGSIDFNRAATLVRYNTTSDANLKNIIGDSNLEKSIGILNSTKIKEFSWKEDETNKVQTGVIAQELYETYKGAVSVGSDESLLGTEDYKSWKVDKTAFTFHLIAGWQKHEQIIQELKTQNDALQSRIETLESK